MVPTLCESDSNLNEENEEKKICLTIKYLGDTNISYFCKDD